MPYVARPKSVQINYSDDLEGNFQIAGETVIEDSDPIATGLVDIHGDPIYRVKDHVPFGFHRGRER